jgi:hypothetical protein
MWVYVVTFPDKVNDTVPFPLYLIRNLEPTVYPDIVTFSVSSANSFKLLPASTPYASPNPRVRLVPVSKAYPVADVSGKIHEKTTPTRLTSNSNGLTETT